VSALVIPCAVGALEYAVVTSSAVQSGSVTFASTDVGTRTVHDAVLSRVASVQVVAAVCVSAVDVSPADALELSHGIVADGVRFDDWSDEDGDEDGQEEETRNTTEQTLATHVCFETLTPFLFEYTGLL